MTSSSTARRALFVFSMLAACAEERAPGAPSGAGRLPAASDAGQRAGRDAAPLEVELDAAAVDGGMLDAAGEPLSGCSETAPHFSAPFNGARQAFSLAVRGLDAHLVYSVMRCQGVEDEALGHALAYLRLSTSGAVDEPRELPVVGEELCARVRDPSLVLEQTDGTIRPMVGFLSTREAAWAVYQTDLEAQAPAMQRVSAAAPEAVARLLTAGGDEGERVLVWAAEQTSDASALWSWAGGDPQPVIDDSQGFRVRALRLGSTTSDDARFLLLWASDSATQLGIFALPLDAQGAPVGTPQKLTDQVAGNPGFDVEPMEDGGAIVVYNEGPGEGEQLRFVTLDASGSPNREEVKLTSGNLRMRGVAMTRFAAGYAVASRFVLAQAPERARIRLLFIDRWGNLAGYRDLLETSSEGGDVAVEVASDGRLVLAYREVDAQGASSVHVARVTCVP